MNTIQINEIKIGDNIRKGNISKESIKELAKSIKTTGLLHPITVKKNDEGYLLIAGHRRLKALKLLGHKATDALILDISDITTIQIAENIQRLDLTPDEESKAFNKALNTKDGLTVQDIASITGKSLTYIHSIANLINLISEFRTLLANNVISLSIALHIAKFPKNIQKHLDQWDWHDITLKEAILRTNGVQLILSSAQFDIKTCDGCLTRTGAVANLFPQDKNNEKCLNVECFKSKSYANLSEKIQAMYKDGKDFILVRNGYINIQVKDLDLNLPDNISDFIVYGNAAWSKTKKATKGSKLGIIVESSESIASIGKTIYIKLAKQKTTKQEVQKAKDKGQPTPQGKADDMYFSSIKLSKKREKFEVFTNVMKQLVVAKIDYFTVNEMKSLFEAAFHNIDYNARNNLCKILFPDIKEIYSQELYTKIWDKRIGSEKTEDLKWEAANKWLFLSLIATQCPSEAVYYESGRKGASVMLELAKRLKIDIESMQKGTAPEYEAKRKLKLERFEKNHGRKPKKS